MSRNNVTRADSRFAGRAAFGPYQAGKPGIEFNTLYRWKPSGSRAITFTGALAAGATSATLSGSWSGPTGLFKVVLSDGETLLAFLTSGGTTCTFYSATMPITGGAYGATSLAGAVTSAATVLDTPPIVGASNNICASQSINSGTPGVINGTIATGGVATMDVPRNVIAAWTGTAVLTVTGTDAYGQTQSEASASGTSFTGKKAFATITAVNVSANTTSATVGTGNVLGFPFKITKAGVFSPMFDGAADAGTVVGADETAVATATTGDVRGTYAPAGTLNSAKWVTALLKVADDTTQVGSFGVTPA